MQNSKPILLIEDDRVDAMTVKRALKELDAANQLVHKTDGEEALKHLRDQSNDPPCVILMDLNTPRMNGMEFLQIIKADQALNRIPVVVMSTSNEAKEVDELSRLGACRYIVKSVDYGEFVESLRAVEQLWSSTESPLGVQSCSSPGPMMPY